MRSSNRFYGWEERLIDGFVSFFSRIGEHADDTVAERPKFVGFTDLMEVLGKPSCPVCYIAHRSLRAFLSVALIEQLTVPEFREPLRLSLGYCRRHSEYVRSAMRNRLKAMGVAIIYEDLLDHVRQSLGIQQTVPTVQGCPLCVLQTDIEQYSLQLIGDYCNDPEFQKQYEVSHGLCFPHLRKIVVKAKNGRTAFLVQAQQKIMGKHLHDLAEFIRKHDYRNAGERMSEAEGSSWKSAVRFLAGVESA